MFWPQERIDRYVVVMNTVAKFEEAAAQIAQRKVQAEQRNQTGK